MSDNSIATMEKHSIAWSKALSVLIIVAGIVAIVVPPAGGIAATLLIGWLLVFAGMAHLVFGWHTRKVGGLGWAMLLGLIYLLTGLYTLLHPLAGLAALTLLLGAYLSAQAILEFVLAWHLRRLGASAWLVFNGVVMLLLAAAIWSTWPSSSEWVIGTFLGVSLIFSGVGRLRLLAAAQRAHLLLA
ncbi:MAG: DUF308 domain-containing protein [Terracidiphilus sp.]|nr:DUF308 domain-containing protein [Terracidiphilus sp.]MDR3798669.1 DUF308 domain-containing protein [Terracidiphilus sp.]